MMKSREFYNVVMSTMSNNAEVIEFCSSQLEKLNEKAKKSAEKRAEGSKAREVVAEQILDIFPKKSVTVAELFEVCVNMGVEVKSPQALTYILTKLRENGNVAREVIKKKAYYSIISE